MVKKKFFTIISVAVLLACIGVPFLAHCQNDNTKYCGITTFTLDAPITIMSASSDTKGASFDNRYLGYFTILQLKPDLFYMYYECSGTNRMVFNHIAFAYSTDGMNWVRSYPKGVKHTVYDDQNRVIENSNLISFYKIREFDVVKVLDPEYPFRMVAN